MSDYVCLVGLDDHESNQIRERLSQPVIAHMILPKIVVKEGQLWAESERSPRLVPVSKVIFHGIFDDDLDFITGLALWGGACLPNPMGMMDCRLKFPCLVRALQHTRFGSALRGYASSWARFESEIERVAKWGNWHCGENKERFTGVWSSENAAIIEPFFVGQAVRVVLIGNHAWQIRLEGEGWLKSIHHASADFMPLDGELWEDTENLRRAFGLEIIANDYMVAEDGTKHLLEVNHIPNVTRFPEIWQAYRDYVVDWLQR